MIDLIPELLPYKEVITKARKKALIASIEKKETSLWSSKIGGNPYLPAGFDYPMDEAGQPMLLLAQINFSELPALEDFPSSGILQFYLTADDDLFGLDFDDQTSQRNFRVIFHEPVHAEADRLTTDFGFLEAVNRECFPVEGEYALQFRPHTDYLPHSNYAFEAAFGQDSHAFFNSFGENRDSVGEFFYEHFSTEDFKVGGYPFFTQHDPRFGTRYREFDVLLLQIISEEDIMWGDVGVGNFFIRRNDLLKKDFSNVLYNWDCT